MESVWDRLEKRRKELKLSIKAVADLAKVSVQALYQLKKDPRKGLRGKNAVAVSIALKCNERWLMEGVGTKERSTKDLNPEELEIIENYRKVTDPEAKKQILGLAKLLGGGSNKSQK